MRFVIILIKFLCMYVCNSLPDELINSDSFDRPFKRFLKTILFSRYYCYRRIRSFFNEMRYMIIWIYVLLT